MRIYEQIITHPIVTNVHTEPLPLPQQFQDILDTIKQWAFIIAGALAVVAVIVFGISMLFSQGRGEGNQLMQKAGWIIGGLAVISGGAGLVAMFLPGS
jgi:type IV secretory pathway VirB2 component (pilin)